MKKRLSAIIILCLLVIGVMAVPAYALSLAGQAYVIDDADVLTDQEEETLNNELSEASAKYNTDIIALVTSATGIDPDSSDYDLALQDFSDEYLAGYISSGGREDAVLYVVDTYGRGYHVSTHGNAIYAFADNDIYALCQELLPSLKDNDYYGAISEYGKLAGGFIDYKNVHGHAYSEDVQEEQGAKDKNIPMKGLIGAVAGILGSLGITGSMKSKLKTVVSKTSAEDYFDPRTLKLNVEKDTFLYMNVSRIPIKTDPPKGSGGGFSTHTSSGGGTFGGGGGRF